MVQPVSITPLQLLLSCSHLPSFCEWKEKFSQKAARDAESLGLIGYKHNTTRATH